MNTRSIAACAMTVALLVAAQIALSFVPGVELVTAILLCFCYHFGVKRGMLVATAFSLVRCLVFGFVPHVVVLYLVYYNLFAIAFGIAGKKKMPQWLCPLLLTLLAGFCAYFAIVGLPVSIVLQKQLKVMLWILFGIALALIVLYAVLAAVKKNRELANVTALAAFFTVTFTLLDDVITPLFGGFGKEAAVAYFYQGFTAMLPQTICAAVSVFALFYPLKKVFERISK